MNARSINIKAEINIFYLTFVATLMQLPQMAFYMIFMNLKWEIVNSTGLTKKTSLDKGPLLQA